MYREPNHKLADVFVCSSATRCKRRLELCHILSEATSAQAGLENAARVGVLLHLEFDSTPPSDISLSPSFTPRTRGPYWRVSVTLSWDYPRARDLHSLEERDGDGLRLAWFGRQFETMVRTYEGSGHRDQHFDTIFNGFLSRAAWYEEPKYTLPSTIYYRFRCPDILITRRVLGLEPNAREEPPTVARCKDSELTRWWCV